jgi:hypothetical protein
MDTLAQHRVHVYVHAYACVYVYTGNMDVDVLTEALVAGLHDLVC